MQQTWQHFEKQTLCMHSSSKMIPEGNYLIVCLAIYIHYEYLFFFLSFFAIFEFNQFQLQTRWGRLVMNAPISVASLVSGYYPVL